jgi:hypothetical protein
MLLRCTSIHVLCAHMGRLPSVKGRKCYLNLKEVMPGGTESHQWFLSYEVTERSLTFPNCVQFPNYSWQKAGRCLLGSRVPDNACKGVWGWALRWKKCSHTAWVVITCLIHLHKCTKLCSKWMNLIICKLLLLCKKLSGSPLGNHPVHGQYWHHTGAFVQQELSDLSGHSARVLSLTVLLPLPTQPSIHVILVWHLVHKASWETSSFITKVLRPWCWV